MNANVALVLAAGKGTRMKSDLPKVLIKVLGRPMIEYVLDALFAGGVQQAIVVVGYQAALVRSTLDGRRGIGFAFQAEQLGTGHAVMSCRERLLDHVGPVLTVTGDAPLMQAESIAALFAEYQAPSGSLHPRHGLQSQPRGPGANCPRQARQLSGDCRTPRRDRRATSHHRSQHELLSVPWSRLGRCAR